MMIRFACPVCRSVLSVPEAAAGKKGSCPKCGQRLQVPAPRGAIVLGDLLPESPAEPAPLSSEENLPPPPTFADPPPRPRMRPLALVVACALIGVPCLGVGALGLVGFLASREKAEEANTGTSVVTSRNKAAPARSGQAERMGQAIVSPTLTEDQRIAWRKVRKDNTEMPVRVLGCLHAPPREFSFGHSAFGKKPGEEDWYFANQDVIYTDREHAGEEAVWAGRGYSLRSLGTAYFAPTFSVSFEQTERFRTLREEQAREAKKLQEVQQQRMKQPRPSDEMMDRLAGPGWREALDRTDRKEREDLRRRYEEGSAQEKEHFEKHKFPAALRRAEELAPGNEVKAMAVVDLFGGDEPRILRWYWSDGQATRSSESAPNRQRQKSLELFLDSLMRRAGNL